jgi:hypothetical protein
VTDHAISLAERDKLKAQWSKEKTTAAKAQQR